MLRYIINLSACLVAFSVASAQDGSWGWYGQNAGGTKYSALKQINEKNAGQLSAAWTFRTGELAKYAGNYTAEKACFETTPVLVGRTLYFSTPSDRVFAVDAKTGQQRWVYDPEVNLKEEYSEVSNRGVAVWPAGGGGAGKDRHDAGGSARRVDVATGKDRAGSAAGAKANGGGAGKWPGGHVAESDTALRIFIGTIDGRLIALNGVSGRVALEFGDNGSVNLKKGYDDEVEETSPPTVVGNLVIVGSALGDNQRFDYPAGVVRAYDVHSGRLVWSWNPIPRDPADTAYSSWIGPKAHQTGGANAWSILSADIGRDLLFVPTTSAAPDYYGGERLGANHYANSLVALRASTGELVWSFQVVHHDLWDFDIAAQPVLIDLERDGKKIPAVVVGTKMGHIFVLDRLTGASLFPVEERPVPVSDVAGEQAWLTQPFPVLPAPLGIRNLTIDDAWGPTPEDREVARRRFSSYRNEGPFTPPGFQGSIMAPGNVGGIHWGGMCYDPVHGWLITNINDLAAVIRMIPRAKVDSLERVEPSVLRAETGRQRGTPYVMKRDYMFLRDDRGIVMQTKPPFGTLVAIDLHTGRKRWEVPLGYMMDPDRWPEAKGWGSINFGGAIVTAGNLIFVGASMDGHFRAFDSQTGKVVWETALPAGDQATPMTYSLDGRQYVVIAAGGHGKLGTKLGDYLMAYSLPEKTRAGSSLAAGKPATGKEQVSSKSK